MQKSKVITIVGVALIAAAILFVLGSVFLPRMASKREMRRRLFAATDDTVRYIAFVDPLYTDPQSPFGGGRTVALEGETLAAVREALQTLGGQCAFRESRKETDSALDRHILVKTADGDFVQIFLTEDGFYYLKKGKVYLFTPKDPAAFAALLSALQGASS